MELVELYNLPPKDVPPGHDDDIPLFFEPSHWVHLPGENNKHLITVTGAVKRPFTGERSEDWKEWLLRLYLPFPREILPPKKWFQIERGAPFFTINAVDKGGDNHNGGWAVTYFKLGPNSGPGGKVFNKISIEAFLRVRGTLFSLFRVGYTLTVCGVFADPPETPPID